ncbi:MAG TPA: sensor histidine kinase, partial [Candidatus Binataceae bacterium]|nr:sensor histidine kinase [Candidatus Binataceae bacterium]
NLETTIAPDAILVTLVRTIAQALKLPYVALETGQGDGVEIAAAYGEPLSKAQRIPLTYQSETLGHLLAAPRSPNEPLSPADLNLLRIIAQQAGMAVHAVQLSEDLQRSRERLVVAREEERRRIRRDLHDGLGPALASLAMQADNAREWTHTDPAKTEAALAEITAKAQDALQDIRRLVYDLRPPALDELGLVGALRQTAANSPNGLHIEIDAPEPLPRLSAAVEVAAYRIAQETLNNIMRHSHARNCTLRISIQDELRLEIGDDGVGLPPDVRAGVGLISMRERAVELGGSCVVESGQGGGTRVIARLPLAHGHSEDG